MAKAAKNADEMRIVSVSIADVKVNPNNPRIIKDDKFAKLVQSIKDLPQMLSIRPIVVNADMVVLGGNMRLKACKEAGMKEVPIIIADNLTEEQQREFLIKDNVSGGEWDWDILANEWDAQDLNDWGVDVPVFNDIDFEKKEGTIDNEIYLNVHCRSEKEAEKLFDELNKKGYECKIIS